MILSWFGKVRFIGKTTKNVEDFINTAYAFRDLLGKRHSDVDMADRVFVDACKLSLAANTKNEDEMGENLLRHLSELTGSPVTGRVVRNDS